MVGGRERSVLTAHILEVSCWRGEGNSTSVCLSWLALTAGRKWEKQRDGVCVTKGVNGGAV
jgi:hypothetical protein